MGKTTRGFCHLFPAVALAVAAFVQSPLATAESAQPCPTYPPVLTAESASMYKPGTDVPDAAGVAEVKRRQAPINDFQKYLAKPLDQKDATAASLACPYSLLRQWADADALLQPPADTPGHVGRIFMASSFSFIVLKFQMRGVQITPDVVRWLSALAAAERQDFGKPFQKSPYTGLYSNVYPWVGVTNAISALVSHDREAMRFQDEAWNNMIAEIHPDGILQGELGRGQRALMYHQMAATGCWRYVLSATLLAHRITPRRLPP